MNFTERQEAFINLWATVGTQWGISKSVAQVHALLLTSDKVISTDDVMERLKISRGNANMSLKELLNWNLINKIHPLGERKEHFEAIKDVWEISKRIIKERKRREIEPLIQQLNDLKASSTEKDDLSNLLNDLEAMITKMNKLSDKLIYADEHKFLGLFTAILKK